MTVKSLMNGTARKSSFGAVGMWTLVAAMGGGLPLQAGAATGPNVVITPGIITTSVGTTSNDSVGLGNGGAANAAALYNPTSIRYDAAGNLYILDAGNYVIRKVIGPGQTGAGTIVPFAGVGGAYGVGLTGDGGPATAATFSATAHGLFVTPAGVVYVSDSGNHTIRKIDLTGKITTVAGTPGVASPPITATVPMPPLGDGGLATAATLSNPGGIFVDANGNIYIADTGDNVIRLVTASTGIITTFAGNGTKLCATFSDVSNDGCPYGQAILLAPSDVYGDPSGNIDILDAGDFRVRRANLTTGLITSIIGTGAKGSGNDVGSTGVSTAISGPDNGLFVDTLGNVYLADTGNSKVRMLLPTGQIYTVAGNGTAGSAGDGFGANTANLNLPQGVVVDAQNNVYIADTVNSRVREVMVNNGALTLASSVVGVVSGTSTTALTSLVTFLNTGTTPLAFTSITITPPFSEKTGVTTDCTIAKTVATGATCTLTLVYTPTTTGFVSGTATVVTTATNAPMGTSTIQLYGDGLVTQGALTTTTALSSSFPGVPTMTVGQSVGITATVAYVGTLYPTGTVVFTINGGATQIGTATLNPFTQVTTVATTPVTTSSSTATLTTTMLPVGIDSVVATYLGDTNFKSSVATALPIAVFAGTMDFGFTATPTATSVALGGSLNATLNVFSINGYANTVGFSCPNLPPTASCSFTPFTAFIQPGKQSVPNTVVTITFPVPVTQNRPMPWRPAGEIAFAMMLCGAVALRKKGRAAVPTLLLIGFSFLGLAAVSGCNTAPPFPNLGGGQTYNIQITASDNVISHTVTIPVTVN